MIITAIDPGLRDCGWATLDGRGGRLLGAGHVTTAPGDGVGDTQRRLVELVAAVEAPIRRSSLVVVEWSSASGGGFGSGTKVCPMCKRSAGGNAQAALLNAAVAAAVIGLAQAHQIQVLTPAPVTWRAALGHARDEAAIHRVIAAAYPRTVAKLRAAARPHVLDAIGLTLYGRAHATNLFNHNRTTTRGTTTP